MATKRKILIGYATIVNKKGIRVKIAEIKRTAMKRKMRKQRKPSTEMMMSYVSLHWRMKQKSKKEN